MKAKPMAETRAKILSPCEIRRGRRVSAEPMQVRQFLALVPARIKQRAWIAALTSAVVEVVHRRIDAGCPHVGITVEIPMTIEQLGGLDQRGVASTRPQAAQTRKDRRVAVQQAS
jgi:hypothetical protein